jgi:hypothetical protein
MFTTVWAQLNEGAIVEKVCQNKSPMARNRVPSDEDPLPCQTLDNRRICYRWGSQIDKCGRTTLHERASSVLLFQDITLDFES